MSKEHWSPDQYEDGSWVAALLGGAMAFIWLGTDYWLFGVCAIAGLVGSFWYSIEAQRHK